MEIKEKGSRGKISCFPRNRLAANHPCFFETTIVSSLLVDESNQRLTRMLTNLKKFQELKAENCPLIAECQSTSDGSIQAGSSPRYPTALC